MRENSELVIKFTQYHHYEILQSVSPHVLESFGMDKSSQEYMEAQSCHDGRLKMGSTEQNTSAFKISQNDPISNTSILEVFRKIGGNRTYYTFLKDVP